jgi:hypothetical protein
MIKADVSDNADGYLVVEQAASPVAARVSCIGLH